MDADRFDADMEPTTIDSNSQDLLAGTLVAVATTVLGGYACGLMINEFGSAGSISLWALGFLSGLICARIIRARNTIVAGLLIAACLAALVISETLWIQWNIRDVDSFLAALAKFPTFLKEFKVPAFIAGIFTLFGGLSAYRQVAT